MRGDGHGRAVRMPVPRDDPLATLAAPHERLADHRETARDAF
ncbi:hypothetical protein ABZX75_25480 [Streptomyces sp. NPDC003038]